MTTPSFSPVTRVTSVHLDRFRGFKAPLEIDTDADLVLISGPNGHGKTGLLDALTLLLTGWHAYASANDLISRPPIPPPKAGDRDEKGELRERAEVRIEGLTDRQTPFSRKAVVPKDEEIEWSPKDLIDPGDEPTIDDPVLKARLSAFFQDRLEHLFDETTTGVTFRDTFETVPQEVKALQEWIGKAERDFRDEISQRERTDLRVAEQRTVGRPKLQGAWVTLAADLKQLAETAPNWPAQAPAIPDRIADEDELDRFARALLTALEGRPARGEGEGLREAFSDKVTGFIQNEIEQAQREAREASDETARLERERVQIQQRLQEIDTQYPRLDEDLRRFASDQPDLPDALAVFRALARHAHDWANLPDEDMEPLRRPCAELGKVNRASADVCAEALATWLDPRRQAGIEKQTLANDLIELRRKIERSLKNTILTELKHIQERINNRLETLARNWADRHEFRTEQARSTGRAKARAYLLQSLEALEKSVELKLSELTDPSKPLLDELAGRVEDVLWRFQLVDGVLPLELVPEDQTVKDSEGHERTRRMSVIRTADGRLLQHLSTGQRAQVGVSLLVAQNLAATRLLNHRIILLDDVTTAYDLSNLTREAILWRQFAYGVADDNEQKRQIFISSHHEDMTNHMLDLLVPPPGRSMRLIRFVGWSNETGPVIETYRVEPSEKVSNETLGAALAAF